ncbi:hypothetical protein HELRODRAFT_182136 [Helobdella robusta]|uniref:Uncharacterized protein n=1 Tax=Helobdella robusta TaxID=6412 RepID=T1FHT6_HELRO|nr:hypothetical protein HELRODRAFT_182136 [Helobdella robusta]ESN91164.1 hypothetical protein HELRODRAFT_182136 [Helobdella robusta]
MEHISFQVPKVANYARKYFCKNTEFILGPRKLRRQSIFWRGKVLESQIMWHRRQAKQKTLHLRFCQLFMKLVLMKPRQPFYVYKSQRRPLQWFICMLHLNELPFRAIYTKLDSTISGPTAFHGNIGSRLNFDPKSLQIVNFKAVPDCTENVSDEIKRDLSEDQCYMLRAILVVQEGKDNAAEQDLNFWLLLPRVRRDG